MGKKLSILMVFMIAGLQFLFAQSPVADSLRKLLNAHPQQDTVRVDLLNNLAYEIRRNKPASTDSLIKIAVDLAGKLDYKSGKGYALAIQCSRFYTQLKYKAADSVFVISKQYRALQFKQE